MVSAYCFLGCGAQRTAWWCVAAFSLAAVAGTRGEEPKGDSPRREPRPELIDPLVAVDAFAGQTVRDRDMGMKLIEARGKKVPRVGALAPDFELRSPDGKRTVRLSSYRNKKPVVLIFGSHT